MAKQCNFTIVMLQLCRVFVLLFPLIFYSTVSSANNPGFSIVSDATEFSPFEENGKFGLKNTNGEVLIPAEYDQLGWSDGAFSVIENVTGYHLAGKWGLINLSNQKVTKAEFTQLTPGDGHFLIARKKLPNSIMEKTGCITSSGKIIVPFAYDGIQLASLRAIVFERTGNRFKHGLIDLENNVLIPLNYQNVYPLGSLRYAVVSFDNKTAIFSEQGKQLTAFAIDSISSFRKNYAVIYQDRQQGLINREGLIVLQPTFREISVQEDGFVNVRSADTWFFMDGANKLKQQYNADSVQAVLPGLFRSSVAGKMQLVNANLKPVSPLFFSSIGVFKNGKAVFSSNGKRGVLRASGSIAIEPTYEDVLVEGAYVRARKQVGLQSRWILLDSAGRSIGSRSYDYIAPFNGQFFPVVNKGFHGAMDTSGKEVIACVHDSLLEFKDDHIAVKFKGQFGIISNREEWIVTPRRNRVSLLGNGLFLEKENENIFLKSFEGDVIYFTSNRIETKEDHLLEYQPSGTVMKIDFQGRIIDRFEQEGIEAIFPESEGYRAIKRDGRYGFIDSRSRLRIANRYEEVKAFSDGMAAARILGKWGFINKEDKIAVQPVYEEVFSFQHGFAVVRQKDQYGLIDKKGKLVLPVRYESITALPSKRFLIRQNGLIGLANENGQIVLNTKYNFIQDPDNGYLIVERDGKFGVITIEGISTIPMIYDGIEFDSFHNQYIALKKAEWQVADLSVVSK